MKKWILLFWVLMMTAAGALADTAPVKMAVPPEAITTQAEGELEDYSLTFPADMPLAARNFVRFARAEFEKNGGARLPKCNEYTRWYYHDKREIGWCSVFQLYCAYHSGLQLVGRWLDGTQGAAPKPGYLVIYGVRQSTPYTHVAIVESVKELGGGLYELTTIEGNLNSTVRRLNYRYDANPKQPYRNMSVVPTDEITQENCQYTLQKDDWYVTGFCATW